MNAAVPIQLRPFRPDDAEACLSLFCDCVHRVNIRDYTQEQVDAWAPPNIDSAAWTSRFSGRLAYVAVEDGRVIGFTDMTREGHLDRLFVSADHQGRGIARLLIEAIIRDALSYGINEITTDASITAKPFFQRMGFSVICEQSVDCRGVQLTNYRMRRVLAGVRSPGALRDQNVAVDQLPFDSSDSPWW